MATSIRSQFVVPAALLSTVSLTEQDLVDLIKPDRVTTLVMANIGKPWPPPTYEEFLADCDRKRQAGFDQMFDFLLPADRKPLVMPPARRKPFRSTGARRMIGF